MDVQAIILATLRGLHVTALASLAGTLVSLALVAPPALREAGPAAALARRRLVRLAIGSDVLALALGIAWALQQTAAIAGTRSIGATMAAVGPVLRDTQYGHMVLIRLMLLVAALPFLAGRGGASRVVALLLAGGALGMQGTMGHAGAAGGNIGTMLLASEAVHLIAAGAWLGGLLPLLLLVRTLPPHAGATACQHFSPIGLSAVVAIACTAVIQAWQLIGSLAALFGTAYGHVALLKLGLFLLLLTLAAINRFVLTERLRRTPHAGRTLMQTSLALEALLGAAVIVVAAFLASGTPGTHETPVWPFSRRVTLDLLADPAVRALLLRVLIPSLAAAVLAVAGWFLWRPLFWAALAGLIVCLVLAWPDLEPLLTVEAYPTTFASSPSEFAVDSIAAGAPLFAADCTQCHGSQARGDGPAAAALPIPPADLTAPHFWAHTEGDLYWYIAHGVPAKPGVLAMPAFGDALSSGQVWSLIDFLKANNAGASMRASGRWDHPIPLPQFDAICADGSAIDRDDLANKVVHIIAADQTVTPAAGPPDVPLATIVVARDKAVKPAGTACVTVEPDAWTAFALLFGESPDAMAGTQALADQNGWLRLRWRPGDPGDWSRPAALDRAIRDIAAHPLPAGAGGGHGHHH